MKNWPQFDYYHWKDTYATLHRFLQIVGKIRLSHEPWCNHSWSSSFYVTSRGLGTSAISLGEENFSLEFDFIHHQLIVQKSDGREAQLKLQNESVSTFYEKLLVILEDFHIPVLFDPHPNELEDAIAFEDDRDHKTYVPKQVHDYWITLVRINNIMKKFRSGFIGKCSPVHFFWGAADLAVTRFSGRAAPEHPGGVPHLPNRVVREAYSHEVSSCGFWAGNDLFPEAAFYSYAYPEPNGFMDEMVKPFGAYYHSTLREFILPYSEVIKSADPEKMILEFFQSTFEAAAVLGGWEKVGVEGREYLMECQEKVGHIT